MTDVTVTITVNEDLLKELDELNFKSYTSAREEIKEYLRRRIVGVVESAIGCKQLEEAHK